MTTILLAAATFSLGLRAFADSNPSLVDGIQAIVNDSVITSQQIDAVSLMDDEALRQQYRYQQDVYFKKITELRSSIFTNLIEQRLILSYFKTLTNKVNESILNQIVMDEIHDQQRTRGIDKVQFIKELQQRGITFEDYKQKFRDGLIVRELIHENVPEPIISPQKIENYYQAHHDNYKMADQVKMRMIVLNKSDAADEARKRGEEILSQLKSGASFAQMATVNSEGSQRKDGGETGWEDFSELNETLRNSVDKLKPGEYSGVVETPESFYLLLLEDRHPAHVKPLSDVRIEVENTLKSQEMERLRRKWIDRLKAKTYIGTF